jgi:hypothetical protein
MLVATTHAQNQDSDNESWQRGCLFAYYPSMSKAAIDLDFTRQKVRVASAADRAASFTQARVSIHSLATDSTAEIAAATLPMSRGKASTVTLDLPPLEGNYEARYQLIGGGDPVTVVVPFERLKFPWEGNKLGITNEVFPPFTPVTADAQGRVSVVRRTIELDGYGLWKQVTSLGQPMLAGPMSLRYKLTDGSTGTLTSGSVKLLSRTDQAAIYEGSAASPVAKVMLRSTTEFDGMTRVEMTLSPGSESVTIERLWLDIPIRHDIAKLMHNVTDTNRVHYAGVVPAGDGVVWSSDRARRQAVWRNSFNAYIWLGQEERGIAWFAENDKDWLTERNGSMKPIQQVVRDKDATHIEVSFINTPSKLTRPHRIVFGVQASPTKPMRSDWRALNPPPQGNPGPVNPWGGITCSSKVPYKEQWQIVDKFIEAKRTGVVDEAWFKDFAAKFNPPMIHGHINWLDRTIHQAKSQATLGPKRAGFVYYEEMRADTTTSAWQTFQNDWGVVPFTGRSWPTEDFYRRGIEGGALSPVSFPPTYQDYGLHYADQWLSRGVSLYWDNTYPQPCYNPVTSDAYVTEDGTVQPALILWNQREYQKRVWNLLQERRKTATLPLEWTVHMTTTLLLPLHTFATVQLDNELATAEPLRPDYIRTEMIGRQVGNFPHSLYVVPGKLNTRLKALSKEHAQRINWGMSRVHEVGATYEPLEKLIRAFGYGDPSVEVVNYWQTDATQPAPVKLDRDDVYWLLLRKKQNSESMLVLASWNPDTVQTSVSIKSESQQRIVDAETGRVFSEDATPATIKLTAPYGVAILLAQPIAAALPEYVPKFDPKAPPVVPEVTGESPSIAAATVSGNSKNTAARLPTEQPAAKDVLFTDDFQSGQAVGWASVSKGVRIVTDPDDNTGKNRIARLDAPQLSLVSPPSKPRETTATQPVASLSDWKNFALRYRFRVGPYTSDAANTQANATFLSMSWRKNPSPENPSESQVMFVQTWRATKAWRFDGPRVAWFGKNEPYVSSAVTVRSPMQGIESKVDQAWHEIEVSTFATRTQVRFDGQIIFDGKDDRTTQGGFSITSNWDDRARPAYIDIDDVIAWRLSSESQLDAAPAPNITGGHSWVATRLTQAPTIDGNLDDTSWAQVRSLSPSASRPWYTLASVKKQPEPVQAQRRVWLAYDEQALYISMDADAPAPAALREDATGNPFLSDGMEIHLRKRGGTYLHFGIDFLGRTGPGQMNTFTELSSIKAAAHAGDKNWTAELRVPWSGLGVTAAEAEMLELNLASNKAQQPGNVWIACTATPGMFNLPPTGPALICINASKTISASRVSATATPGGKPDEAAWQRASAVAVWQTFTGKPLQRARIARLLWDEQNLYVSLRCAIAGPDAAISDSQSPFQGDTLRLEFAGHSVGIDAGGNALPLLLPYQIPFTGNATRGDKEWTAQMTIPWSHLGGRPVVGKPVRFNLSGHDTIDGDVSWRPVRDHRQTQEFGELLLIE